MHCLLIWLDSNSVAKIIFSVFVTPSDLILSWSYLHEFGSVRGALWLNMYQNSLYLCNTCNTVLVDLIRLKFCCEDRLSVICCIIRLNLVLVISSWVLAHQWCACIRTCFLGLCDMCNALLVWDQILLWRWSLSGFVASSDQIRFWSYLHEFWSIGGAVCSICFRTPIGFVSCVQYSVWRSNQA